MGRIISVPFAGPCSYINRCKRVRLPIERFIRSNVGRRTAAVNVVLMTRPLRPGPRPRLYKVGAVTATPKLGFIGLGAMGEPMAASLLRRGFSVTACAHRRREPL